MSARRWKRGWELHVEGVGVTQSRRLTDAELMVRDYVTAVTDTAPDSFDVEITPEIGAGVDAELVAMRAADREAATAQEQAAALRRRVAGRLDALGLSGREIAAVLMVSPQRVSQLLGGSRNDGDGHGLRGTGVRRA
ncbi:MAG TPA: hypothetical protein VFH77_05725 [Streptomyces sp.]|nr:hypothetical protein [Streptomyces sp.]